MIKQPPLPLKKHLSQQNSDMIRPNINLVFNINTTASKGIKITSEPYPYATNRSKQKQLMKITEKYRKKITNNFLPSTPSISITPPLPLPINS